MGHAPSGPLLMIKFMKPPSLLGRLVQVSSQHWMMASYHCRLLATLDDGNLPLPTMDVDHKALQSSMMDDGTLLSTMVKGKAKVSVGGKLRQKAKKK